MKPFFYLDAAQSLSLSSQTPPQPLITISGWKSKPQSRLLGNLIQSSRYPGSPSLLSPVTEEDEEPVHSDETSADDHDDIMQWSEQDNDMSSEEFREVIE
ncbi:hypothetical protein ABKV19_021541 [Rosa sericea]